MTTLLQHIFIWENCMLNMLKIKTSGQPLESTAINVILTYIELGMERIIL